MPKSQECREEARGRPGVPDEKFGFLGRDVSPETRDGHFLVGLIELNVEAQDLQRFRERKGIIRKERVRQTSSAAGESRNEQGAICQGLGAGDADGGVEGVVDGGDLH